MGSLALTLAGRAPGSNTSFANTSYHVGPYAKLIEVADPSWLAGLVVTGPLYDCLASRSRKARVTGRSRGLPADSTVA